MEQSIHDLLITRQLLKLQTSYKLNSKQIYEWENILERFIVAFVNENETDYIFPKKIEEDNKCLIKLKEEIKLKHIPEVVYDYTIQTINKDRPKIGEIKHNVSYTKSSCIVLFNFILDIIPTNLKIEIDLGIRKIDELKKKNNTDVANMLLKYESMVNKGQQWAVPNEQYKYLNENYGVEYEGFASPINSGLSDKKNGKFCSLFPEIDKPFGSIGKFFDQHLYSDENPRHWCINPPFVEQLIDKVTIKIIEDIEYAVDNNLEVMVFYILPNWTDCKGFDTAWNSKYTKFKEILYKGTYIYEAKGKPIKIPINSAVMILDSYKKKIDYSKITKKMQV